VLATCIRHGVHVLTLAIALTIGSACGFSGFGDPAFSVMVQNQRPDDVVVQVDANESRFQYLVPARTAAVTRQGPGNIDGVVTVWTRACDLIGTAGFGSISTLLMTVPADGAVVLTPGAHLPDVPDSVLVERFNTNRCT
jgi:hypothetical protein